MKGRNLKNSTGARRNRVNVGDLTVHSQSNHKTVLRPPKDDEMRAKDDEMRAKDALIAELQKRTKQTLCEQGRWRDELAR